MERLISKNDFEYYTMLKKILFDLDNKRSKGAQNVYLDSRQR